MIEYWMILVAQLTGLVLSFLVPYFAKKWTNKIESIDYKYVKHLTVTAVWQFISTFTTYNKWRPPASAEGDVMILIIAFLFGYGGSTIQKQLEPFLGALQVRIGRRTLD